MARTAKNMDYLLIQRDVSVPAFEIGGRVYSTFTKIPAECLIALLTASSTVVGLRDYIVSALIEADRADFQALMGQLDVDGLSAITEEIVAATTPFDGSKSNTSAP